MSDRIKGLVVTLDDDYRSEDAERIIAAIGMVRGVLAVDSAVADLGDHMNRERIRMEWSEKLWDVLHPKRDKT